MEDSNLKITELNYNSSKEEKNDFIESYLSIWNNPENLKYLSFTGQLFTYDMLKHWIYGLKEHSEMKYFYANISSSIAGIIVLKASRLNGYSIGGLGVLPEYKRKGIGTELTIKSIEDASQSNFKAIDTTVYADNKEMLILTIKIGFQPYRINVNQRYDGMNIVSLKKIFKQ